MVTKLFRIEMRDYVDAILSEYEEKIRFYNTLIISSLDPIQANQYQRELRHIELFYAELKKIYNMTKEK